MASYISPLARAVKVNPDAEAIVDDEVRLTYAELNKRCERLAGALDGLGLQPGDRVAVLARNSHRYLEAYIAIPAAGYVIVPLNIRHTVAELRYILGDARPRVLLTDQDASQLKDLFERVIEIPSAYEMLLDQASPRDLRENPPDGSSIAGLFYTGGTTGQSKGVVLTHDSLIANATYILMSMQYDASTRFGLITPMFHSGGNVWLFPILWAGGCCVTLPSFEAGAALDLFQREKVTRSFGITTMFSMLAEEQLRQPRDISALLDIGHAGQPCPDEVLRRGCRAFPDARIWTCFGTTETTGATTIMQDDERFLLESGSPRLGSCGQAAVGGVEIKIVRDEGTEAATGEVGEVAVRGGNVMKEYWNKPEQTAAALKDGWYYTGDLGYVDKQQYVFLVDRKKDMIISGGENVYSTEVETVLYRHPAVLEAAVFGVPDEKWGEAVHAVVVLRSPVTERELVEYCREHIAGYKVPKHIDIHEAPLPKSGPGKILKQILKKPFWENQKLSIH
jgi:long-chain acyl-CoA synthetase